MSEYVTIRNATERARLLVEVLQADATIAAHSPDAGDREFAMFNYSETRAEVLRLLGLVPAVEDDEEAGEG